jgi:hypothetical protein
MKTTVEMPDDLYREAKIEAARRGATIKELVEQGLRTVLGKPGAEKRAASLADLMRPVRGLIDSGITDLGSNPEHLAGFGRDASRHR